MAGERTESFLASLFATATNVRKFASFENRIAAAAILESLVERFGGLGVIRLIHSAPEGFIFLGTKAPETLFSALRTALRDAGTPEFLARFEDLLGHDSYQTRNRPSRETESLNEVLVKLYGSWFTREKAPA